MQATDNLATLSRMVNAIVTHAVPIWDSVIGWSGFPLHGRAPIFLKSTLAQNWKIAALICGALVAGCNLDGAGDTFNGVFDHKLTVVGCFITSGALWPCGCILTKTDWCALCGMNRKPFLCCTILAHQYRQGGFKIDYMMHGEDTADSVTVEFFNEKHGPDEVTVSLPDSSAEATCDRVALWQYRQSPYYSLKGLYMAARQIAIRRMVSFKTGWRIGPDLWWLIAISHDMPRWWSRWWCGLWSSVFGFIGKCKKVYRWG